VVASRWRRKWNRARRKSQVAFVAGVVVVPTGLWAAGLEDGTLWVACYALLVAGFSHAHARAGARMFMKPVEVYDSGIVATRRARWLAPRRFVTWNELEEAKVEGWGDWGEHLVLPLRGGGALHTIPGELDAAGVGLIQQRLSHARAALEGGTSGARP
jgi:hypothetical protein